jgi:hypothetical protein
VLKQFRDICLDAEGVKRLTWEWISELDALGLAVWFMDDGNLSQKHYNQKMNARITAMPGTPEEVSLYWKYFAVKWNLYPRVTPRKGSKAWTISFTSKDTAKLLEIIKPYLYPTDPETKVVSATKKWCASDIPIGTTDAITPVKVVRLEKLTFPKGRPCYDVTVAETHTLIANGLASSNCAAYGDHPSVINFIMDGGSGGSSLFGHSPKDEIENSKEHGFLPSLLDMASWLTRVIIKPQYDDLKLIIEGFDQGDEKQRQEIFLNKVKTYQTKNEARMSDGSEPEGFWLPREEYEKLEEGDPKRVQYEGNPYNYPADAPVATYITALASKKQMESMAQQPEDGGDPNDPNQQQEGDGGQPPEDDGNPWAAAGDQSIPMQKSRPEVKYLRISIEG